MQQQLRLSQPQNIIHSSVKTNINGAMNLIDACIDQKLWVVALSTDKASSPVNFYGATKLASDKHLLQVIHPMLGHNTCFSVVRVEM